MKSLKLPKYHKTVILIYLILLPIFFIFFKDRINYNFTSQHFLVLKWIIILLALGIAVFFLLNSGKKYHLNKKQIPLIIIYSFIFAIPEEILFRGIIQGVLQEHIANILLVILISSLVFGIAHLLNSKEKISFKNLNWKLTFNATLLGIPLGFVFAETQSLLIPTTLHALAGIFSRLFVQNN